MRSHHHDLGFAVHANATGVGMGLLLMRHHQRQHLLSVSRTSILGGGLALAGFCLVLGCAQPIGSHRLTSARPETPGTAPSAISAPGAPAAVPREYEGLARYAEFHVDWNTAARAYVDALGRVPTTDEEFQAQQLVLFVPTDPSAAEPGVVPRVRGSVSPAGFLTKAVIHVLPDGLHLQTPAIPAEGIASRDLIDSWDDARAHPILSASAKAQNAAVVAHIRQTNDNWSSATALHYRGANLLFYGSSDPNDLRLRLLSLGLEMRMDNFVAHEHRLPESWSEFMTHCQTSLPTLHDAPGCLASAPVGSMGIRVAVDQQTQQLQLIELSRLGAIDTQEYAFEPDGHRSDVEPGPTVLDPRFRVLFEALVPTTSSVGSPEHPGG